MEDAEELEEVPYRDYWESFEILEDEHGKIRFNGLNPEDNFIPSDYTDNSYYNYFYLEEYNSSETVLVPDTINPLRVPYNFFEYHDDETIPEDKYIQSLKEAYETGFSDAQDDIINFKEQYYFERYKMEQEVSVNNSSISFKTCFVCDSDELSYELFNGVPTLKMSSWNVWQSQSGSMSDLRNNFIAIRNDLEGSSAFLAPWESGTPIYFIPNDAISKRADYYVINNAKLVQIKLSLYSNGLQSSSPSVFEVIYDEETFEVYNKVYGQVKNIWNNSPIPKTDIMKIYSASEQVISPDWLTHINNRL